MPRDIFRLAYSVKMEAEKSDTAELMLYGEIVQDGPKEWKWSEEDKSAAEFDKAIKDIKEQGAKNLLLRINSPGGVCTESVAMRSILANAGFEKIDIRIEGLCASAATDIATLPGAHVAISEGSEYMIHNPWCVTYGNANEIEHTIERLRNIEQMSRSFYVKRTGQDEEQIKAWMDAETWFTAEEAVEYGFADEVLSAEASPIAACVSSRTMATMKGLYNTVPEQIAIEKEVSNGIPEEAGEPTEINISKEEDLYMELSELTVDQLREGNPALLEEIRNSAVAAERDRLDEIDALTIPGYEEIAAQAKANGTSAIDFQKQVVSAMKQKGTEFMQSRKEEVAPAANVAGGAPEDTRKSEEEEIMNNAKEIAAFANTYSGGNFGSNNMF